MEIAQEQIYHKLNSIYQKHRRKYKGNRDSKQMCLMWSTSSPPDIIEGTQPFCDIENAFDIVIEDDQCLELYDMDFDDAVVRIAKIIKQQHF